jgi:hypothetical protein
VTDAANDPGATAPSGTVSSATGGRALRTALARWEPWLVPVALLALAAILRFVDLPTRGTWDGDQGHDMLTLRAFVRDGVVPLLGPPTSIGEVHHGAWYYYLLSPVAFLTGGDSPLAIVAAIALAGTAAVGVAWWLGRSIAGPWAGALAGLVLAVSTAAVDESTFIWNPNLIALSSGLALTGAWLAWRDGGGSPWWWLLAAVGTAITMQCHILGVALLPVIAVPFVLDARRRTLGRAVPLAVLVTILAAYLPLAVNELTTGFSETNAALDYLGGDRESGGAALPVRFGIVGLRVVSWPLVGLVTAAFLPAVIATAGVVAIAVGRRRDPASRWLGLGLLWSSLFLTVAAPSLAVVVPGLPNDHYHAFADPMVVVLVALGLGALVVGPRPAAPVLAGVAIVALLGWNLTHQPPAIHPDGGWPAGEAAGDRVIAAFETAGVHADDVVRLRSLPDFKSTEAVAYPLDRRDRAFVAEMPNDRLAPGSVDPPPAAAGWVLLCDDRFREAIGAPCGGPAEDAAATRDGYGERLDRFEAAPGRWVSVYRATGGAADAP